MKKFISALLFISINFQLVAATNLEKLVPIKVSKYETGLENSLVLTMNFGHEVFISQANLNLLEDKTIYQIDLVYTAYKSSPTFNQFELNQRRIGSLLKLIPKIENDQATWKLIEQSGAKTAVEAKSYFHGFVIHYGERLDYNGLKDFFSTYQKPMETFVIDNQIQSEIITKNRSRIIIQPNSIATEDGNIVQGEVVLTFQEFRNPAEIALSGIPMTYNSSDGVYNFSSVGMYELGAEGNGQELKLVKPIQVDFNCTDIKNDVSFYQMNKEGEWKELQPIKFQSVDTISKDIQENVIGDNEIGTVSEMRTVKGQFFHQRKGFFFFGGIKLSIANQPNISTVAMNKKGWRGYLKLKADNDTLFSNMVINEIPLERTVKVKTDFLRQFNLIVLQPDLNGKIELDENKGRPQPNNLRSTLLGGGSSDPGHTYPTVVRGLNSADFGVYNCDQIYRIGKSINISPIYVNAETGNEILNKHVTCVMDLTYNGSFSFHPNNLTLNADGRNVILLFTAKKEIFMFSEDAFAALPKNDYNPTLNMINITDQVKTSQDLKGVLGI